MPGPFQRFSLFTSMQPGDRFRIHFRGTYMDAPVDPGCPKLTLVKAPVQFILHEDCITWHKEDILGRPVVDIEAIKHTLHLWNMGLAPAELGNLR